MSRASSLPPTGRDPGPPAPPHRLPGRWNRSVAALALAAVGAAGACSDGSQPAGYEAPRGASRVIVGLATEITSEGRRVMRVEADSGFAHADSGLVTLVGVEARTFDDNGRVRATLEADSGRLDEMGRVFTAMGNVRVSTQDGLVSLETAELVYDPSTGQLRSDSAAVVTRDGVTQQGTCFEGDPLLAGWRVCGGGGT